LSVVLVASAVLLFGLSIAAAVAVALWHPQPERRADAYRVLRLLLAAVSPRRRPSRNR
jgi:hypothetical protein